MIKGFNQEIVQLKVVNWVTLFLCLFNTIIVILTL